MSGYVSTVGSGSTRGNVNVGNFEVKDNLTYITGPHSMRFGYHFRRNMNFFLLNSRSSFAFAQRYTNNNLADFLLGLPSSASLGGEALRGNFAENGHFFYVQDDWRVSSRLTVNLGLRYEYRGPWKDKRGFMTNVDPYSGAFVPPLTTTAIQPWETGRFTPDTPLVNFSKNGWQPRIGLAYRITRSTVLRGGYGIFGNEPVIGWIQQLGQNPRLGTTPVSFLSSQTVPTLSLSDPFNSGNQGPNTGLPNVSGIQQNLPASVVHNWGFTIQQQLGSATLVEAAYVGKTGIHDFVQYAWNDAVPGTTPRQSRRPFPQYNSFNMLFADGTNSYNGLELRLQHRPNRTGLTLTVGYTVAKGIDDVGGRLAIAADPSIDSRNVPRRGIEDSPKATFQGDFRLVGFMRCPSVVAKRWPVAASPPGFWVAG